MDIKKLRDTQQIFIEAEDWQEVSRIEYEISTLEEIQKNLKPKKEFKIEPWFRIAMFDYFIKLLNVEISQIIYVCKRLIKEDEDGNNSRME